LWYIIQIPAIDQAVNPQYLQDITECHRFLASLYVCLILGFYYDFQYAIRLSGYGGDSVHAGRWGASLEIRVSEVWAGGVAICQG